MEDPVIAAAAIIQARLPAALEALYTTKTTPSPEDDEVDAAMSKADTSAAADNPEQARMYHIPNNPRPYWASSLRTERFSDSDRGLLYRPVITRTLLNDIESCLGEPFKPGIMVKGPEGIGKSHTLVNLCMLLESCPKYHVTFFPDCNDLRSIDDFVAVVFASFGITNLADRVQIADAMANEAWTIDLLGIIDGMLQQRNIKWIFIFDQVNAIFGRPDYNQIKDVHKLPFPYNLMGRLMTPNRIMSIICAPANNEISHREGHEGFRDFHHEIRLEVDEAKILFPHTPQEKMAKALEETGAIPLQMYRLIVEAKSNEDHYRRDQFDSIVTSLDKLKKQLRDDGTYPVFLAGIIQTLLKSPTTKHIFDRKYFVDNPVGDKHCYKPLFPLVEEVYVETFWDDVMAHIESHEEELLQVCKITKVDQGSRGRHFEFFVIRRCMMGQFDVPVNDDEPVQRVTIPSNAKRFSGKTLPGSSMFFGLGGVMVPNDPNFPAVDILLYIGTTRLIGVQIHVSDHENTVDSFEGLCRGAKLDDHFDSIEMWCLSPTTETADKVRRFCGKHDCRTTRSLSKEWSIDVKARTINDISCLRDMPWSHPSNRG